MPIQVVHRKRGKATPEAYLMAGGKYLIRQSSVKTPNYLEDIKALKLKIEAKHIITLEMAQVFFLKDLRFQRA